MTHLSEPYTVLFGESGIQVYCGSDESEAVEVFERHKEASRISSSFEFIPVRMTHGSAVLREYDPASDKWDD